jgi:hypothetical protein
MSAKRSRWFARGVMVALGLSAVTASSGCKKDEETALSDVKNGKYHVGEKWSFQARTGEDHAAFTVVKVEANPKVGTIVHVSVEGVRIKSPLSPGGFTDTIAHMPFAESAIDNSVIDLVSKRAPIPEFEGNYRQWRKAFEAKRGTIFTATVKDAIGYLERSLN